MLVFGPKYSHLSLDYVASLTCSEITRRKSPCFDKICMGLRCHKQKQRQKRDERERESASSSTLLSIILQLDSLVDFWIFDEHHVIMRFKKCRRMHIGQRKHKKKVELECKHYKKERRRNIHPFSIPNLTTVKYSIAQLVGVYFVFYILRRLNFTHTG